MLAYPSRQIWQPEQAFLRIAVPEPVPFVILDHLNRHSPQTLCGDLNGIADNDGPDATGRTRKDHIAVGQF